MKRLAAILALAASPALAHPGHGVHLHEGQMFWLAAAAFAVGTALTLAVVLRKPAKVRA